MSLIKRFFILICLAALCASPAKADPKPYAPVIGDFSAANTESSNQVYSVQIHTAEDGANINIGFSLSWTPGVTCEFDAVVPSSAVNSHVDAGITVFTVDIPFADGFSNKGTMHLEVSGSICKITFDISESVNTTAARQYGSYTLNRENP